jgi:polyisoprenoid-binding protein YceI
MSILTETPVTVIPAGTWSVDPAHSTVEFQIKHMGLVTVRGYAPVVAATITGGDAPSIEGTVDATALTTFDETRDGHLQAPDFFDTARYPELRFESTAIALQGDALAVEGSLTIKGVTKPVVLEGTLVGTGVDPWGNDRLGIELTGTIDRTEFGVSWNAPLPAGGFLLPDDVTIVADFSAVKAA